MEVVTGSNYKRQRVRERQARRERGRAQGQRYELKEHYEGLMAKERGKDEKKAAKYTNKRKKYDKSTGFVGLRNKSRNPG